MYKSLADGLLTEYLPITNRIEPKGYYPLTQRDVRPVLAMLYVSQLYKFYHDAKRGIRRRYIATINVTEGDRPVDMKFGRFDATLKGVRDLRKSLVDRV